MTPRNAVFACAGVCLALAGSARARDWRTWPFTATSPWNMPIGAGAHYAPVPGLAALPGGLNFADRWTSAVVVATRADPLVHVRVNAGFAASNWRSLMGGARNCGNAPAIEAEIRAHLRASPAPFPANPWSSLSSVEQTWQLPPHYHDARDHFSATVHMPPKRCPSPDADGLMAVFQPDGWVLDTYATIILANGDIAGDGVASFIDARGDGTGWWNGRRASMLPSFAGLIRTGEIAAGRIPHALAIVMSQHLLAPRAVWPAYAFDRHAASYAGTLPMGALLALPDVAGLRLTATGTVLARAARDYGAYVVDSTNGLGATILAELNDPEIRWPGWQNDVTIVVKHLQQITNNTPAVRAGGGARRAPLAPDLRN